MTVVNWLVTFKLISSIAHLIEVAFTYASVKCAWYGYGLSCRRTNARNF